MKTHIFTVSITTNEKIATHEINDALCDALGELTIVSDLDSTVHDVTFEIEHGVTIDETEDDSIKIGDLVEVVSVASMPATAEYYIGTQRRVARINNIDNVANLEGSFYAFPLQNLKKVK